MSAPIPTRQPPATTTRSSWTCTRGGAVGAYDAALAVSPALDSVLVLGLIVVIRTVLSFSLETEIEGVAPWRRALSGVVGTLGRASASGLDSETPP